MTEEEILVRDGRGHSAMQALMTTVSTGKRKTNRGESDRAAAKPKHCMVKGCTHQRFGRACNVCGKGYYYCKQMHSDHAVHDQQEKCELPSDTQAGPSSAAPSVPFAPVTNLPETEADRSSKRVRLANTCSIVECMEVVIDRSCDTCQRYFCELHSIDHESHSHHTLRSLLSDSSSTKVSASQPSLGDSSTAMEVDVVRDSVSATVTIPDSLENEDQLITEGALYPAEPEVRGDSSHSAMEEVDPADASVSAATVSFSESLEYDDHQLGQRQLSGNIEAAKPASTDGPLDLETKASAGNKVANVITRVLASQKAQESRRKFVGSGKRESSTEESDLVDRLYNELNYPVYKQDLLEIFCLFPSHHSVYSPDLLLQTFSKKKGRESFLRDFIPVLVKHLLAAA